MSNLDNLISKIIKDCTEKSNEIIKEAEAKASEITREHKAAADKEKEKILEDARAESEKTAERIITGKKLELRDAELFAKQSVIDSVFDNALQRLNDLPAEEFGEFLRTSLSRLELDGEELVLPQKYGINIEELNDFLKRNGRKGNLRAHNGSRVISGGFVLIKEGIENNNTFEALIQYYRGELESEIITRLF